jgi:hypothetical protein
MVKKETIKIFAIIFGISAVYLFLGNDDYHKKFDKPISITYNCREVFNDRVSSVPPEVLEQCSDKNRRSVIVKIYQE